MLDEAFELWDNTATAFYQGRLEDGMADLEKCVEVALQFPELTEYINMLLDAIGNTDYVLAADVLHFEMVERMKGNFG